MRLKTVLTLFAFLLVSICIAADEPKAPERPQSPAAVAAMRERDKAIKDAEEAYHQAQIKAERAMIAKLKVALAAATKAGNLSEANAINGQIKIATVRVDELSGKSLAYAIRADKPWQQVTTLDAGDYAITVQGKWKWAAPAYAECGPNGSTMKIIDGKNVGALLVMVGEKQALTGERATIHVESDGTPISFRMNDDTLQDNEGALTVSITKTVH
ncbi:MAG: hypothetical protein JWN24_1517 [Phycisphaerales bacterium]|jgi:hypothetical protein|nr:hypothetical protein [Phycisphaerales bacterium]